MTYNLPIRGIYCESVRMLFVGNALALKWAIDLTMHEPEVRHDDTIIFN